MPCPKLTASEREVKIFQFSYISQMYISFLFAISKAIDSAMHCLLFL